MPLHVQVEQLIRELIASPVYKDGALLPREVDLANRLGVSRNTIRQATNKLELEGLILRKKGVGTIKAPPRGLTTGLDHWYSFTQEMKELGIQVTNLELKVTMVTPPEKVARFFAIDSSRKVVKLTKLKGVNGDPIVFFQSYFHPRIGIDRDDNFNMPLYSMLERQYGVVVNRSVERIKAELAGKLAAKLKVHSGEPVLKRERLVYDVGDRPMEYNIGYYRSDKFTYSINIKKGG